METVEIRSYEWKIHNLQVNLLPINKPKRFETQCFHIVFNSNVTLWKFSAEIHRSYFCFYLNKLQVDANDFIINTESSGNSIVDFYEGSRNVKERSSVLVKKILIYDFKTVYWPEQYLVDGTLIFSVKINITEDDKCPATYANNCSFDCQYRRAFMNLFVTKDYSDFTFICSDDRKIRAHRFVLAESSPVMKAMFDAGMIEIETKQVKITDIDGDTMYEILQFIYTGSVFGLDYFAPKLLYAAEKYGLDKLKKRCIEFMTENLSEKNALEYFILADQYDATYLLEKSALFIKDHHNNLSKDNENWKKLSHGHIIKLLGFYKYNPDDVRIFESTNKA